MGGRKYFMVHYPRMAAMIIFGCLWFGACQPAAETGTAWGGMCYHTFDCAAGLVCRGNLCSRTPDAVSGADGDRDKESDAGGTDGDCTEADHEPVAESEREYQETSGPFWPVAMQVYARTNPQVSTVPVTLHFEPVRSVFPPRTEILEQNTLFDYGPLETADGRYVFSAPGFNDVVITRLGLAGLDRAYSRFTLHVELQTTAASLYRFRDEVLLFTWQGYDVYTAVDGDARPLVRVFYENNPLFTAYGQVITRGNDGLLYIAQENAVGGNLDFLSIDAAMQVTNVAPESLCNPLFARDDLTGEGIILMTGCDPSGAGRSGMLSRYVYATGRLETLGAVNRDTDRSVISAQWGIAVQGPERFFLFDGVHTYHDDRWLLNFNGFAHDGTVVLSSGFGRCVGTHFADHFMRACPLAGGNCHDYGPVLQYFYDDNSKISEVGSFDGVLHSIWDIHRSEDMPDYRCWATSTFEVQLVHMDEEGRFSRAVNLGDNQRFHVLSPSGSFMAHLTADKHVHVYRLPEPELQWELPGAIQPDTVFPDGSSDGVWHQPMAFLDDATLLLLQWNMQCRSGQCGDLVAFDMHTGQTRLIEHRVRAFRVLPDGGVIIGRACVLPDICDSMSDYEKAKATIIEYISDIAYTGNRSTPYLLESGICEYTDERFSVCQVYRDPLVRRNREPLLLHMDFRSGASPLTEVYRGFFRYSVHTSPEQAQVFFSKSSPYRAMAYAADNPSVVREFGCHGWTGPVRRIPGYIIDEGRPAFIPEEKPDTWYRLDHAVEHIDESTQSVVYRAATWDGSPDNQAFVLSLPRLEEIMEPQSTCE